MPQLLTATKIKCLAALFSLTTCTCNDDDVQFRVRRALSWCALSAPPTSPSELLCMAVLHSHAQVSDMPLRGVPPTNKGLVSA